MQRSVLLLQVIYSLSECKGYLIFVRNLVLFVVTYEPVFHFLLVLNRNIIYFLVVLLKSRLFLFWMMIMI